jgi:hypothetical protein
MIAPVHISEGAMICAMLGAAPKALFMRPLMSLGQLIVVLLVTAIPVVVVIMRQGGHSGYNEEYHCGRYQRFS